MDAGYRYLEHTADAEFIAYGEDLNEVFVNAAKATFGLIIDPALVRTAETKEISLDAEILDYLIYDWISELLYIAEIELMVFGKFEASVTQEKGGYSLKGKAYGEKVDPARHAISLHIKAVTYHDLRVEKKNNLYEAQILLDI